MEPLVAKLTVPAPIMLVLCFISFFAEAEARSIKVARTDLLRMAVQIKVEYKQDDNSNPPVVSSVFDSLWMLPVDWRTESTKGWNEFTALMKRGHTGHRLIGSELWSIYLMNDYFPNQVLDIGPGRSLTVLSDHFREMNGPQVLVLWEAVEDSLEFMSILDHAIRAGSIQLEESLSLADSTFLLRGRAGAEGGGGVWFAHFAPPASFEVLYRKSWSQDDAYETLQVAMDCALDPTTLAAVVSVRQRGAGLASFTDRSGRWTVADSSYSGSQAWTVVDVDTVRVDELIRIRRTHDRENR
jgi:hypothetical protein